MRGNDRGSPLDPKDLRGNGFVPALPKPQVRIDVATFYRTPPHELLARLTDGDPLDLELRCTTRRNQLAYLVSRRRLFVRTAARTAYAGYAYRGKPPLSVWLESLIDQSLREILEEDDSGHRGELPVERPDNYRVFAECLGLEVAQARAVCAAFNELEPDVRRTFFAITIARMGVETFAKSEGRSIETALLQLGRAIAVLTRFGARAGEPPQRTAPTGIPLGNWPADW